MGWLIYEASLDRLWPVPTEYDRLGDEAAVERLSAWLATEVDGTPRGDANIIGTASKPDFIASVEACRRDPGAAAYYRLWRLRWFELDRYASVEGRREGIARALGHGPRPA